MRHHVLGKIVAIVGFVVAGPLAIHAQDREPVPIIEPQLTRLYGSDSLNLWNPATQAALSPDGRWLVFNSVERGDRMNLWIASVERGEAVRLTKGPYFHGGAQWFPSGDRIAFRSDRFARGGSDDVHIVTLAIDPETGRPRGTPRQITLEGTHGNSYAISPDGRWIAYTTRRESGGPPIGVFRGIALKVLPSNGGTARTVVERDLLLHPAWALDGRSLFFVTREQRFEMLERASIEDGYAEVIFRWPAGDSHTVHISPDGRHYFRHLPDGEHVLGTIAGDPLARFRLPERMSLTGFSSDGKSLLASMQNTVAPLKILPVAGGPARQLDEARAYDWPIGWTDDEHVLFGTRLNGEKVMLLAPLAGGPMRQISVEGNLLNKFTPTLVGKHLLHVVTEGDDGTAVMRILDIETGRTREVSRSLWLDYVRYNPLRSGDQFLYAEIRSDRYELRSVRPGELTRLLWRFPREDFPEGLAVHGDRIAFTRESSGEETSLYMAVAGEREPRRLLTRPGRISPEGGWGPVWSPDGSMLALAYSAPGAEEFDVMLVEISESGELVGEPRILTLDGGPSFWAALQWLPDQSGFLVWGMGAETALDTDIWLISLDPTVAPLALTKDDPHSVWNFSLAPDGKHIAYSSEMPMGGSIWKVDLQLER